MEPSDFAGPATRSVSASFHEEAVGYPDRLVIAPVWGHLLREPLDEGQIVEQGAVIGKGHEARREVASVSAVRGAFGAWFSREGRAEAPQGPGARLRPTDV